MDNQVCVSSFYFTLVTVAIVMLAAIVLFQYNERKTISCPPCPNNSPETVIPKTPPMSPDDQDDLMVGELPPRRRDYRKLHDPLKEPTRRYVDYPSGYPHLLPHGNVNIPTQGYLPSYQQLGYLTVSSYQPKPKKKNKKNKKNNMKEHQDDPNRMLKLFGRRIDTHRYEYYVIHHLDESLKIPLNNNGDRELMNGDDVHVPGYPGTYKVNLYQFEGPKYIPYF